MTEKTLWRIKKLPREEYTDDSREVQAFWGEPDAWENGSATNSMQVMANHPDLGKAYNIWGRHLLITNTVPMREREIAILRVAWLTRSQYEWHNHVGYGLNYGMSLDEIAALKEDVGAWDWNELDRAIIQGTDELVKTYDMTDATWDALARHWDKRQMMDFVHTVGHYVMIAMAMGAMRIPVEETADLIGWDLKTRSGKIPGATLKPGEGDDWIEKRGYSEEA